jgi:hypothetical protein
MLTLTPRSPINDRWDVRLKSVRNLRVDFYRPRKRDFPHDHAFGQWDGAPDLMTLIDGIVILPVTNKLRLTASHRPCPRSCPAASDIDDCRSEFGDDPADADELAVCIRDARDDYRS